MPNTIGPSRPTVAACAQSTALGRRALGLGRRGRRRGGGGLLLQLAGGPLRCRLAAGGLLSSGVTGAVCCWSGVCFGRGLLPARTSAAARWWCSAARLASRSLLEFLPPPRMIAPLPSSPKGLPMASWPAVSTTPAITKARRPVIRATFGLMRPITPPRLGCWRYTRMSAGIARALRGPGLRGLQPPGGALVELLVAPHAAGGGLADLGLGQGLGVHRDLLGDLGRRAVQRLLEQGHQDRGDGRREGRARGPEAGDHDRRYR